MTTEEWAGIDTVLARLRDTGLMVDQPSSSSSSSSSSSTSSSSLVRGEPRTEPGEDRRSAGPTVEWDLEPHSNVLVAVRCPGCGIDQHRPGDVTRFRCHACGRSWRWAICEKCGTLRLPSEQQEVWRCSRCSNYTRAWWRTATALRDARAVVAHRQRLEAEAQRETAATVRRRRVRLVVVALVLASAIGGVAFLSVAGGSSGPVTGTEETCRQFDRLRADLGSGTVGAADLEARLTSLRAASAGAEPAVSSAVAELAAVGRPSEAAFLVAQTKLADACAAAGS